MHGPGCTCANGGDSGHRIGNRVIDIQHVGSTAVAGLSAKPILDIAVRVRTLSEVDRLIGPLAELGYIYKSNRAHSDRRFFAKGTHHESVYLHCFHAGAFKRVIQFRDALRRSARLRREYSALKSRLARRYADDRTSYTMAKAAFVERVIRRSTH